jgi:hypothetical protein
VWQGIAAISLHFRLGPGARAPHSAEKAAAVAQG